MKLVLWKPEECVMLYRTERQVEGAMQWLFTVLLLFCIKQLYLSTQHQRPPCPSNTTTPSHPISQLSTLCARSDSGSLCNQGGLTFGALCVLVVLDAYFLYFYMHHKDQQKKEAHYLASVLCRRILSELVQRSTIESESAAFYRREIEKCQQYISLVQAEATRVWEAPSKPEQLQNIEDVQFFHSEFCLKNKLLHLQQQHLEENAKPSQLSRDNAIRGSMRQRASSVSVFAWSQHRYSTLKQLNQARLTQQKGSRQFSLQKLAPSKREAISQSEKELRAALLNAPPEGSKDRKRAYRKMARKEQPIQGDAGIPVLVQIAYNIGEQSKIRSVQKKQCLPKLEQSHKKLQKMQSTGSKAQTNGRRLVISQYQPHRGRITVNSWRKLDEMIEAKQTDTPSHPHQFTNIHYYTETTTL